MTQTQLLYAVFSNDSVLGVFGVKPWSFVCVCVLTVPMMTVSYILLHLTVPMMTVSYTLLHKLQSVQNATARLITGTRHHDHITPVARYYANAIDYPSESVSDSKLHVWFASRCPGKHLSTWQMTAASCPTALGHGRDSALSAVSWRSDLRGAANTRQLRWQNFHSCWTSLVGLSSGPSVQSRHYLWTVQMTAEGTPFWEAWTQRCVTSDVRRLRKTLTYLLTSIMLFSLCIRVSCTSV